MIRTTVIPQNNQIHLSVPSNYIGKEIEVLLYSKEELNEEKTKMKTHVMSDYKGILTIEEAKQLQDYVIKSREEWDKNF